MKPSHCATCGQWKTDVRGGVCNLCFSKHQGYVHRLRGYRAAVAPELNRPIIEAVADKIIEELKGTP
jgi:hypothetical protein